MTKTTPRTPPANASVSAASPEPDNNQQELLTIGYAMKSTLVAVRQAKQIVGACRTSRDAQTAMEILEHVHAVLDAYVKTKNFG